jgi:segregation and condensation protein B
MTYGTTPVFLEYFGLRALEDLPAADELRRIPVQKPAGLVTVDPGLATTPPAEQLSLLGDQPTPAPTPTETPDTAPAASEEPPPSGGTPAEPTAPA